MHAEAIPPPWSACARSSAGQQNAASGTGSAFMSACDRHNVRVTLASVIKPWMPHTCNGSRIEDRRGGKTTLALAPSQQQQGADPMEAGPSLMGPQPGRQTVPYRGEAGHSIQDPRRAVQTPVSNPDGFRFSALPVRDWCGPPAGSGTVGLGTAWPG